MIIDNKVMNIVINGRTIADDIYDQAMSSFRNMVKSLIYFLLDALKH
jgi:hypothetical protein